MNTTLVRNERNIVSAELAGSLIDIGADASRRIPATYRYRYSVQVKYTLDDGTVIEDAVRGKTRKDLQQKIASDFTLIERKSLAACRYEQDGVGYWMFVRKYGIGV